MNQSYFLKLTLSLYNSKSAVELAQRTILNE